MFISLFHPSLDASFDVLFACLMKILIFFIDMAKSKNHTNHNQNKKAHRNGIKKLLRHRFQSTRGVRMQCDILILG